MPGSSALACRGALALGIGLAGPVCAGERAVAPAGDRPACPSQGSGFVRVPGTTTCLRLSGRVAAGVVVDRRTTAPLSVGRLSIDTGTATEYGPVRAFVRMGAGRP